MPGDLQTVPPEQLAARTHAASARARESGALVPLDTHVRLLDDAGITFVVRVSANLSQKQAAAADRTEARGGTTPADPFEPPYDPDLYVGDLSATHVLLLNKFNVLEDHLLMVTRAWADQTEMLNRSDCEALLLGLAGIDGLAFYNGGREAGASQPHKHLQLVPLPLAPEGPGLPFSDLLRTTRLTGDTGAIPALPFRHAVAPMRAQWLERPQESALQLLHRIEALWRALGHEPAVHDQPAPYNLLVTRQWIWLVPRRQEQCAGLPVNALGYAGALLAGDEAAFEHLSSLGPMQVLRDAAEALPT